MSTIISNSWYNILTRDQGSEQNVMVFNDGASELRKQYVSLVIVTLLSCLVFGNITVCIRALSRQRSVYHVFCMLQACACVPAAIITLIRQTVPWLISCWTVGIGLYIALCVGAPIINCILMERAYQAHKRIQLAWFGCLLTFLLIVTNISAFWGLHLTYASATTCAWTPVIPWVISKCVIDAVNGLFLSVCYIHAVRRRYKMYGMFSGVSKQGMRSGYISSFIIIFSGILVSILMLWPPAVRWSTHLYALQCVLASTLLTHQ
ncbi:hypothetical protein BDF22DRAFT_745278 [Syncephalis plumigaleata]|nr:hypothetical protein BDF22DRAFT_745278 [Syncephalis plumigaleata]